MTIKSCRDCSFLEASRVYTEDSFEYVQQWRCKARDGRLIDRYVEWTDKIPVPKWCPLRATSLVAK
jgi:hypothetical protein